MYKNFRTVENEVFIATLGIDYISGLDYAIARGIMGKNVKVKVYIDDGIDEKSLKQNLSKYKFLFDSITMYKNVWYKDVGVRLEQIKLKRV